MIIEFWMKKKLLCTFRNSTKKNPSILSLAEQRLEHQIEEMSAAQLESEFRVALSELSQLVEALAIPDGFTCGSGTIASGLEVVLMLLK